MARRTDEGGDAVVTVIGTCDRCGINTPMDRVVKNGRMISAYPDRLSGFESQVLQVQFCLQCHIKSYLLHPLRNSSARDSMCFFPSHPGFATLSCADPIHVVDAVLDS